MNVKILILLILITSFFGYLEWGGNNKFFLIEAEAEIIYKIFTNPFSILHPFILFPILGQILLFISLFQKNPNKYLIYFGIIGLSILLGFIFFIGFLSKNIKIIVYSLPFIIIVFLTLKNINKNN